MTKGMRRFLFVVILLTWLIALAISPTPTTMLIGGAAFALLLMGGNSAKKQVSQTILKTITKNEGE